MIKKNILLVSDENYLTHGKILLKSLFLNTNNFRVHYFIITDKKELSLDKVFYNKNIFLYYKKKAGKNNQEIKAYFANSRIEFCKELFLNNDLNHLMYLDVDSILIKDITKLYNSFLRQKEILQIRKRDTKNVKNKFMTGIFLLKKNQEFINLWIKNLENKKFKWFGDQISVYETLRNKKFKNLTIDLPFEYIDFRLSDKSYIWSGRSGTKNYYKYKLEKFLINHLYKKSKKKKFIDDFFIKKILYKFLDYYDQKFTKKFSFLFNKD
jgi:hypothetical protein